MTPSEKHDAIIEKFIEYLKKLDETTADETLQKVMDNYAARTDALILCGKCNSAETAVEIVKTVGIQLSPDLRQSIEFWLSTIECISTVAEKSLLALVAATQNPDHLQVSRYFAEIPPIINKIVSYIEQSDAEL